MFRPITFSLTLVVVVFAVDLCLPLGVASAVPYSFAVLLALRSRVAWFAPALAIVCCLLTGAKMMIAPDRGTTELWKVVANRLLAVFAIGITTILGLLRRQAERRQWKAEEQTRTHLAVLAHMDRLRIISQLAAGLAHELNQPLATVCLHAEVAERIMDQDSIAHERLRTNLRVITTQAHRAADIVKSLRRMARREEAVRTTVDLNEVARTVGEVLAWQARRVGATIRMELAPALPAVIGDRTQLEQVVYNMLQNALEAVEMAQNPLRTVTIQSGREGPDAVFLTVSDTGVGLPEERHRLFESFFTTKPNGTGMGLAISRSIIESHGGRLTAAPAPGGGSSFTFCLPIET